MEGESGVTRRMIDELHSSVFQGDQMEGESDIPRSVIDQFHCSDIKGDQMVGESRLTRSIIDELESWDIQRDQMECVNVFLEVSFMNFILRISNESKWEVKVVLL